jgi:hypothetical protein
MKAEIEKILCIACNDCTDHPADCMMVSNQAQSLTALIIKWLEGKKIDILDHHEKYHKDCHRCIEILAHNQLITELIGEVR